MNNIPFSAAETQQDQKFPDNNWFGRPDTESGTPFVQSPSAQDVEGCITPHQLFRFFTFEIIMEKKVFVR